MNFVLDLPKERLQKKPLKKGSFTKSQILVSKHIIQIHAIKPAVLELSA